MPYDYTNPKRAHDKYALPDVEIFEDAVVLVSCSRCRREDDEVNDAYCLECKGEATWESVIDPDSERPAIVAQATTRRGWFYAFGVPGCLYDSDIYGPFVSYAAAMADARDMAGVDDMDDNESEGE